MMEMSRMTDSVLKTDATMIAHITEMTRLTDMFVEADATLVSDISDAKRMTNLLVEMDAITDITNVRRMTVERLELNERPLS